jgi:hypothetical protein
VTGWLRDVGGQAAVEVAALLPVVVAAGLAGAQVLAAVAAHEQAGAAAEAGAIALGRGEDGRAAALAVFDRGARSRAAVEVRGRVVRVRLRPAVLVPGVAGRLTASVVADAGPAAR